MHKWMARERLLRPLVGGREARWDEAIAHARKLLAGARAPAALVSAHASNEELDAFARLLGDRFRVYAREDRQPAEGEVREDALLIKADKNPNSAGVQARLGAHRMPGDAAHDVVLVWGEVDAATTFGDARVIQLTAFGPATAAKADVALPISTHFERSGTFTNFAGVANAFERVFDPPPGVFDAAEVLRRLAA